MAFVRVAYIRVLIIYILSCFAYGEDFRTPEYLKNGLSFDIVNTIGAYKKGYSGKGVTVGVFDSMYSGQFSQHNEFAGKLEGVISNYGNYKHNHGLHVAGIAVAAKNGNGMHGIAYEANLKVAQGFVETGREAPGTFEFFKNSNVKIINNSVEVVKFPTIDEDLYVRWQNVDQDPIAKSMFMLAKDHDRVIVYASGNDIKIGPALLPALRRYHPNLGGYINVMALVAGSSKDYTTIDGSGQITVGRYGVRSTSNLAKGVEIYSIMAPGEHIYSSVENDGYEYKGGTSMAAPIVSGALALVYEAFPWMTATQLVDTVLSTANKEFKSTSFHRSETRGSSRYYYIYLADGDTIEAYKEREGITWEIQYETLSKETVFGQGILDIGKAVGGISEINLNRMHKKNIQSSTIDGIFSGISYALYDLNTNGHDAVFSNDIKEVAWNDKYHLLGGGTTGSPIAGENKRLLFDKKGGIKKVGSGTLTLSGRNTYKGITLLNGGGLVISKRSDGTGGILTDSDVHVTPSMPKSFLSGNGEISKSLLMTAGTFTPGDGSVGSFMSVGTYKQMDNAKLRIYFDRKTNINHLKSTNSILEGGNFIFSFLPSLGPKKSVVELTIGDFIKGNVSGSMDLTKVELVNESLFYNVNLGIEGSTIADIRYIFNIIRSNDYQDIAFSPSSVGVAKFFDTNDHRNFGSDLVDALSAINKITSADEANLALNTLSPTSYSKQSVVILDSQRGLNSMLMFQMLGSSGKETQQMMADNSFNSVFGTKKYDVVQRLEFYAEAQDYSTTKSDVGFQINSLKTTYVREPSPWSVFATLLGSYNKQENYKNEQGYTAYSGGIFAGGDRLTSFGVVGVNVGYKSQYSQTFQSNINSNGLYAGIHARVDNSSTEGPFGFVSARFGTEYNYMRRNISFGTFRSDVSSSWFSPVLSSVLGVGQNFAIGNFVLGPIAWIDFIMLHQPKITEKGNGVSLALDSRNFESLQGNVGVFLKSSFLYFLAAYNAEMLNNSFIQNSHFNGYGATFVTTTPIPNNHSLLLQLKSKAKWSGGGFFETALSTKVFKKGYVSVEGAMSIGLEF